jgi:hypothetical protein
MLESNVLAPECLQPMERQHAHLGVFERHRLALIAIGADAVDSDDLASHVVAGNLVVAIAVSEIVLQEPDRIA